MIFYNNLQDEMKQFDNQIIQKCSIKIILKYVTMNGNVIVA